jgi:hypothetical protein
MEWRLEQMTGDGCPHPPQARFAFRREPALYPKLANNQVDSAKFDTETLDY